MGGGTRYMKFGVDSLYSIAEKIINRDLTYGDTIIIGDNSSGKSMLLKMLIEKEGKTAAVYFIDAVNRGFDITKIAKGNWTHEYKNTIINTRIQEEYFNLKDSFNCYGTLTERIEEMYDWLGEKMQILFEILTKDGFQIIPGSIFGDVEFKQGKGLLSSGYQAIVRLLMELLYYQEKCIVEKGIDRSLVIIDELDEFLSPGYAYKIFPFIKEHFPKMNFVITTHSCDLIAGACNSNLIVLDDTGFEIMDTNDYQSVSEVQIIFDRVFGSHSVSKPKIEEVLRRLFNNKLNNGWTQRDQLQLEQLQLEQLTPSQQLIYRQIMEW